MHISVLLDECLKYLNLNDKSIIVDCTLGYGGHSSEILKRVNNAVSAYNKHRNDEDNGRYEVADALLILDDEHLILQFQGDPPPSKAVRWTEAP